MSLIKLRNTMSRKRKSFKRQENNKFDKLGTGWKKPRGKHSKLRQKMNGRQMVSVGFRGPAATRGMHPSGKREVLVSSPVGMDGLTNVLVRIGSTVGKKKKQEILNKAQTLKLEVIGKREVKKNEPKFAKKAGK